MRQDLETPIWGVVPFPAHVRTPLLTDSQRQSFGCGRVTDLDLGGIAPLLGRGTHCAAGAGDDGGGSDDGDGLSVEAQTAQALLGLGNVLDGAANKLVVERTVVRRSVSTARYASGEWLARQQKLPTDLGAVSSVEEVSLFFELLPSVMPTSRRKLTNDFEKLAENFNMRVLAVAEELSPGCCAAGTYVAASVGGLRLKTVNQIKTFAETMSKCLEAQRALGADGGAARRQELRSALRGARSVQSWPLPQQLQPPPSAAAGGSSGASLSLQPATAGPPLQGLVLAAPVEETQQARTHRWRLAAYAELSVDGTYVTADNLYRKVVELATKEGVADWPEHKRASVLNALRVWLARRRKRDAEDAGSGGGCGGE